jgi:hypothetical protein
MLLGLGDERDVLDSFVPARHVLYYPVAEDSRDDTADQPAEEGARADVADLRGVECPGRAGEDAGENDGGANVPDGSVRG